jgi:arylsulfatase
VEPPKTPEEGYHLTADLVDKAISFIADSKQVAPNKPFFLYFCPGATHAPHHVPKEWADRYKGQFDDGWDAYRQKTFQKQKELGIIPKDAELSRHDPDVQDWNTLSADEKKLYARMMEVFAGFLTHTDYHYGRLFNFLKSMGEWENTLIMFISDNGASAEGGPTGSVNENKFFNNVPDSLQENLGKIDKLGGPETFNHYPWGWAHAGNTPFRRWKRETYRGGCSDPFIVHWPKGIKSKGEVRAHYAHAIDMVPTVLDLLGLEAPAAIRGVTQSPIQGVSFAEVLDHPKAESRHHTQYFEMFGHRSIYHDGWRAVCPWPGTSFKEAGMGFGAIITHDKLTELDAKNWELYHVEKDWAENHNLAGKDRDKLIEMIATWYVEAGKYDVLPIDSRGTLRLAEPRPQIAVARKSYTYYPRTQPIPSNAGPSVLNRAHSITADVEIPKGGAEGVLLCAGDVQGGFTFFMKDGKLHYAYNYVGSKYYNIESKAAIPEGRHKLRFEFEPSGKPDIPHGKGAPGRGQLYVDEKLAGQGDIPLTMPLSLGLGGGFVCGADTGAPVTPDYKPPFAFSGTLYSVTVDVSGDLIKDAEAEMRVVMARQ